MPKMTYYSHRELHFWVRSDGSSFTVYDLAEEPLGTLQRPRPYATGLDNVWTFTSRDGTVKTKHKFIGDGSAKRMWNALERAKVTPVGAPHPHFAREPDAIAALDDATLLLKYRQQCARVERLVSVRNANRTQDNETTLVASAQVRDHMRNEAIKRKLVVR